MLLAFADELTKEAVKSDIDIHFWTVTIWVIIGAVITGVGGVSILAITMYGKIVTAIRELKTATNAVLPAVKEKVDSATKGITDAAQHVKEETKIAADRIAINKVLSDERVINSVNQLKKTIQGDDGTCVTGRLKKLEDSHQEMRKIVDHLAEGHEVLKEGQVDIVKSMNHLSETLERKFPNVI